MAPDPCRAASSPGLRHQMAAEDRDERALGVREELALPKGLARGQTGLDGRAQTSLPVPVLPPGTFLDLGLLPVEAAPPHPRPVSSVLPPGPRLGLRQERHASVRSKEPPRGDVTTPAPPLHRSEGNTYSRILIIAIFRNLNTLVP